MLHFLSPVIVSINILTITMFFVAFLRGIDLWFLLGASMMSYIIWCTLLLLLIIVIVFVFIIIVTIVIIGFIDYYYYHWSLLLLSIELMPKCFFRGKPDPHFFTHWNSLLACWVVKYYEPIEINTNGRFMSNLLY